MSFKLETQAEGSYLLLGSLNFDTAAQALDDVGRLIADKPVTLDLSGIDSANSAGLALMIEWLAQARNRGVDINYLNIPESLVSVARVCQVDSLISGHN